jgi:hypothetical protein
MTIRSVAAVLGISLLFDLLACSARIDGGMGEGADASQPTGSDPSDAEPATDDGGPDPFLAPPSCTSGIQWTGGTRESPDMQPGEPCVACHTRGEAPRLAFGGTVYPTAHEPSQCYGATKGGATVVVTDANGKSVTATVNAAGNFFARATAALTAPLKAKVVFMGRERIMLSAVPSGDCNVCHTQQGTTTLATPSIPAPGRIILP